MLFDLSICPMQMWEIFTLVVMSFTSWLLDCGQHITDVSFCLLGPWPTNDPEGGQVIKKISISFVNPMLGSSGN